MASNEYLDTPQQNESDASAKETESTDPSPSSQDKKQTLLRRLTVEIFDILELFVFCAAIILMIFTFFIRPTVVQGPSMEDTLLEGDYLLVGGIHYSPRQGDIVVVHNVGLRYYSQPIVKRVIATEGQVVDIDFSTWTVTVDGNVLDEPYRKLAMDDWITSDWEYPVTIPEGYLFVMGDNRNHSSDSRSKDIGLIDERCVVGRAIVRVLPFDRFTLFN